MTATTEPLRVVAGDTIIWQKTLALYPAPTYVLKYRLINATAKMDITATASGSDHLTTVTAATSAAWAAGIYTLTGYVETGSGATLQRITISETKITVAPNLAAVSAAGYDNRSAAQKILDGLNAEYQTRITNGQGFVAEYSIADRRMKFDVKADWIKAIDYWKTQVAAEERAAALANGERSSKSLYVRF
jgi:hypothetical protein